MILSFPSSFSCGNISHPSQLKSEAQRVYPIITHSRKAANDLPYAPLHSYPPHCILLSVLLDRCNCTSFTPTTDLIPQVNGEKWSGRSSCFRSQRTWIVSTSTLTRARTKYDSPRTLLFSAVPLTRAAYVVTGGPLPGFPRALEHLERCLNNPIFYSALSQLPS